jgi:crotonobetainyl-CoA:carnitine CoA-transferase CaiB-like acyl-CoA transferase
MQVNEAMDELPLAGVRVLDFSQYLAGPACALRLSDLGAEVIKIERPKQGDACRQLVVADQTVGEDSLLFHTINRGKKSVAADLKSERDMRALKALIATADVMIHNFRPGVMERIGLGYEAVKAVNPRLVYGVVSGYGTEGIWRDKPGQDLLAQSRSGLVWLAGRSSDGPVPVGVSITDIAAGMHLVQGLLAALFRQTRTGRGALVEVSLLASSMDLQFEQFTSYLNGTRVQPPRAEVSGANVHATAPYGIYATSDGFLAVAMTPIGKLAELLGSDELKAHGDPSRAFADRDLINGILRDMLKGKPTAHWLSLLEPADIWCAEVLDWPALERSGALQQLGVIQDVSAGPSGKIATTTCPIRLDGRVLSNAAGAPALGADTSTYLGLSTNNIEETV